MTRQRLNNLPDIALEFVMTDCREAVRAMPENSKSLEYLLTANQAERILTMRQRLRQWRQELRSHGFDPLTFPLERRRNVRRVNENPYTQDRIRSALWILGFYRRTGLI